MAAGAVWNSIKKFGGVGAWTMNGAFGLMAYNDARNEGDSKGAALAKGAFEVAKGVVLSPAGYIAMEAITGLPSLAYEGMKWQAQYRRQLGRESRQQAFQHMAFQDNQATYTMRQAGLAIAKRSSFNTQQAILGNEAKLMQK